MSAKICPVCSAEQVDEIYRGNSEESISSLARPIHGQTKVYRCNHCTHLFTAPLSDLVRYYESEYNISIESEEDDSLYTMQDGTTCFRSEYQQMVFEQKVTLPQGARLLDYGCAKAGTLKRIVQAQPGIMPMVYDVSEAYAHFWGKFIAPENCFANIPVSESLNNTVDALASFFSLEHSLNVNEFMQDIHRLLKPGGVLFAIVPNVMKNWADLIVADHIQHFTEESLLTLLRKNGFVVQEVDGDIYTGAWVLVAQKAEGEQKVLPAKTSSNPDEIVAFWNDFSGAVRQIEQTLSGQSFAIYGAGFYGAYLATQLQAKPDYFVDQNPHLWNQTFFDVPVISPDELPQNIQHVVVGLNPLTARKMMQGHPVSKGRNLHFL